METDEAGDVEPRDQDVLDPGTTDDDVTGTGGSRSETTATPDHAEEPAPTREDPGADDSAAVSAALSAEKSPTPVSRNESPPAATVAVTGADSSPGAPAPAPLVRQPITPIGALIGAPFALINIAVDALNMLFTPQPTTPGDPPILWGVLAFVQREIQRTFFNSSPHAVADSATTSEDAPTTISVLDNDTDLNSDVLTIKEYTQPVNGTVVLNADGTFVYTPNADFNGIDTFTYTVSDAASPWHVHNLVSVLFHGTHASKTTVTVTVSAVNDAPTMNPDRPETDAVTGVVRAALHAEDVDGDPLTYELSTPSHGTVTVIDGAFVYTPTPEARSAAAQGGAATDTFTITVSDGNGGAVSQDFTVAVTPNIDNITIEMRWAATPRDLDSHLLGPGVDGVRPFHIYYANRNIHQADGTLAVDLAADDRDGFGPELTTIYTRTPGDYLFYVYQWSNDAELWTSEATVTVRDSVSGINSTFTVSDQVTNRYWSVFTLTISDTGLATVTAVDTYGDVAPTLPSSAPVAL
ncbi:Ig-like domain-containing protein [Mycobacterium sp. pV006]|uniref:Ig-like domain-containing protein n=1 Tax=Mycobacterium sp. pV006 TaxID=3238983 RepID=UPI00351BB425